MDMALINWWAVLVSSLIGFLLGGIWYGPLFGKVWMKENGFTEADLKNSNPVKMYGITFICTAVMAFNLAFFLAEPNATLSWGAQAGLLAGFGWIAMAIIINGMFEGKTWRLIAVNAGYMVLLLVCQGAILGAWR